MDERGVAWYSGLHDEDHYTMKSIDFIDLFRTNPKILIDLFRLISSFSMDFWASGIDFVATFWIRPTNLNQKSWLKDNSNPISNEFRPKLMQSPKLIFITACHSMGRLFKSNSGHFCGFYSVFITYLCVLEHNK